MAETLINIFKRCLDILRDNEGLTGDKALRTLSQFLILKLIETRLDEIKIKEYDYGDFGLLDECVEEHKKKMFEIIYFSKLVEEKDINIPVRIKDLWNGVLSKHPTTKNIFVEGKCFDLKQSTYRKILNIINKINIKEKEYDVLGNAYEEVIQDIMTGKVLGQFFTQPLVKKMMVELINPKIYPDGKIESCGDPTMGTGGFLITYLRHILQKANKSGIKLDWNFIKTEGIYGKELEPDTYQLAVSNMLIASGHLFENLERGDSIRNPIEKKFDNILANPPYGIKGLNYDEFESLIKEKYTPIKTNNAVSLFIQAIIYMLKVNGKCAVVLPDGQDLFSKTNKTLIQVREYLMKTCDLKEIIYLPSGIFTYTSINTCVFYFVKNKEGDKVIEIKKKISKTQKETRTYKFEKEHETKKVKFYEYNFEKDIKNLLVEVSIEDIKNNSYSLNYNEYIEKEEQYNTDIEIKTLGDICEFLPKSKRQASYGKETGKYPFFKSSMKVNTYVDEPDYKEESLIIGTGGNANIKYGVEFSCSTDNLIIKINNYLTKYVYYYFTYNMEKLENEFIGTGIKHISKNNFCKIKIPIPSIEIQKEFVEYCEKNDELNKKLKEEIKTNENNKKKFLNNILKKSKCVDGEV
jgi:type I restriction enzyme M protein